MAVLARRLKKIMNKVALNTVKESVGRGLRGILVFWLIIFGLDVMVRLELPADVPYLDTAVDDPAVLLHPFTLRESKYSAYLAKLNRLSQPPSPNEGVAVLSQVPLDAPALGWDLGENRYKLAGVFEGVDRFAVLERLSNGADSPGLIKVKVSDQLEDFIVKTISAHHVDLISADGVIVRIAVFQKLDGNSKYSN